MAGNSCAFLFFRRTPRKLNMSEKPAVLRCNDCSVALVAQRAKDCRSLYSFYKDDRGKRVYTEQLLCEECYQKWKKDGR